MTQQKKSMKGKISAWHFVRENGRLGYGASDLEVAPGYVYSEPTGPLKLCEFGMHASKRVYDALGYAPGLVLCRVRCWGDVIESSDKLVCRHREVLAMRDVSKELRLWGCWCVRNTPIGNGKTTWDLLTDLRSRNAIEIAERYANGEATKIELDDAGAAALAAAGDTARDDYRAAAWAAAWAAVRDGAWTGAAVRTAAWAATAAWAWAGTASWAFHSQELENRMILLFGEN